jgi:hypothetical protein
MTISPNDPRFSFEANPTLEELIAQQGKGPVADINVLSGGWPEEEAVEDFIAALREWRGHGKTGQSDRTA